MSHGCGLGFGFSGCGAGEAGGEVEVVIEQDIWYTEPVAEVLLIQYEDEIRALEKKRRPRQHRTVADDAVLEIAHASFIVLLDVIKGGIGSLI